MANRNTGTASVAVGTSDEWHERLRAAQARLGEAEADRLRAGELVRRLTLQVQHVSIGIERLELQVLLEQAHPDDVTRLEAERDRLRDELRIARELLANTSSRHEQIRGVFAEAESRIRRDARDAAAARYRAVVERMKPLMAEVVTLNEELWRLVSDVNESDMPWPFASLRDDPSGGTEYVQWVKATAIWRD